MIYENFEDLIEAFEFIDDWEDRYRFIIELGRELEPLDESAFTPENKVSGCMSQVWLDTTFITDEKGKTLLTFKGTSDALIVSGLIAILIILLSNRPLDDVINLDVPTELAALNLEAHITPQRSNGLFSMVARIKADAQAQLAK